MSDDRIIDDLKLQTIVVATGHGLAESFFKVLLEEAPEDGWSIDRLAGMVEMMWEQLALPMIEEGCAAEGIDPAPLRSDTALRDLFLDSLRKGQLVATMVDEVFTPDHPGPAAPAPGDQIISDFVDQLAHQLWPDFGTCNHGIAGESQRAWLVSGASAAAFYWYAREPLSERFRQAEISFDPSYDDFKRFFEPAFNYRIESIIAIDPVEPVAQPVAWSKLGPPRPKSAGPPSEREQWDLRSAIHRLIDWPGGAGAVGIMGDITRFEAGGWQLQPEAPDDGIDSVLMAVVADPEGPLAIGEDGSLSRLVDQSWQQLSPPADLPADVARALAMSVPTDLLAVYDRDNHRIVAWRPLTYPKVSDLTVAWQEGGWRRLAAASPPPRGIEDYAQRVSFELVYDTTLRRVVRFGGGEFAILDDGEWQSYPADAVLAAVDPEYRRALHDVATGETLLVDLRGRKVVRFDLAGATCLADIEWPRQWRKAGPNEFPFRHLAYSPHTRSLRAHSDTDKYQSYQLDLGQLCQAAAAIGPRMSYADFVAVTRD